MIAASSRLGIIQSLLFQLWAAICQSHVQVAGVAGLIPSEI